MLARAKVGDFAPWHTDPAAERRYYQLGAITDRKIRQAVWLRDQLVTARFGDQDGRGSGILLDLLP